MKRLLIYILAIMAVASTYSQDKLQIKALFDGRYHSNPNVSEFMVDTNNSGDANDITYIHGITMTDMQEEASIVEHLLRQDGARAIDKVVHYKGGVLFYGFYQFSKVKKRNRYIIYVNQKPNDVDKIALIYIEGEASKEVIYKKFNL